MSSAQETDPATPRLLSVATAVPCHRFSQAEAKEVARKLFADVYPDIERRLTLFDNTGIEERYACEPLETFLEPRGFGDRNTLYIDHASGLLTAAAARALEQAGLAAEAIDSIITVSSTGIATPSLEARIGDELGLRPDVERTPVFGLGCAGGVLGLARAASRARADPGTNVLLLVVELCGLTFRRSDSSMANLVASAIFGDGAAAAVIGPAQQGAVPIAAGEHRWPRTLDVMGWDVDDDGLGVVFSPAIPELIRARLRDPLLTFLARNDLDLTDIDRFVCHPGGAKVLDAVETAFELPPAALAEARSVLRDHGNMSAVSVVFVLAEVLRARDWRRALLVALGPGFTAAFMVLENG